MSQNNDSGEAEQTISQQDEQEAAISFDEFKKSLSKSQDSLGNSQSMKKASQSFGGETEQIQETQEHSLIQSRLESEGFEEGDFEAKLNMERTSSMLQSDIFDFQQSFKQGYTYLQNAVTVPADLEEVDTEDIQEAASLILSPKANEQKEIVLPYEILKSIGVKANEIPVPQEEYAPVAILDESKKESTFWRDPNSIYTIEEEDTYENSKSLSGNNLQFLYNRTLSDGKTQKLLGFGTDENKENLIENREAARCQDIDDKIFEEEIKMSLLEDQILLRKQEVYEKDEDKSQVSFYKNPNTYNDLSVMNISHLTSKTYNSKDANNAFANSPGMFVKGVEASQIFNYITMEDEKGLLSYLKSQIKPLEIMPMQCQRKFTCLAYSAYRNNTDCFKILFEYAAKYENYFSLLNKDCTLEFWSNMRTGDSFTALHFAARHGNYTMLQLLCEKAGADKYIMNKFGSTPIHIAAQQDQPLAIYYLHQQGVEINVRDSKQSTILHWACFARSEMALNYILSMDPDLEAKDVFGFTPLRIAAETVEKLDSTRNVKALLLRGANRETKDFKGKTPFDYIKEKPDGESGPSRHKAELMICLERQSYWECLMLKVPLTPLRKNHNTQTLFLVLFGIIHSLNTFIILPTLQAELSFYSQFGNTISTILVFLTFTYASCKNPGNLTPLTDRPFIELLRDINPADLCPDCKVIRSPRSQHCAICNQCVERFDHHCPWINNCVGIKNHNSFLVFLIVIWTKIVATMYFCTISMVFFISKMDDFECQEELCQKMCFYELCTNEYIHIGSCILCILICWFYFILSSALLITHVKNYMAYKTTNERFSSRQLKKPSSSEENGAADASTSMWSMSDFNTSTSFINQNGGGSYQPKRRGAFGKKCRCFRNFWRMCSHTKIITQRKLYNYLAEAQDPNDLDNIDFSLDYDNTRSIVLSGDSESPIFAREIIEN